MEHVTNLPDCYYSLYFIHFVFEKLVSTCQQMPPTWRAVSLKRRISSLSIRKQKYFVPVNRSSASSCGELTTRWAEITIPRVERWFLDIRFLYMPVCMQFQDLEEFASLKSRPKINFVLPIKCFLNEACIDFCVSRIQWFYSVTCISRAWNLILPKKGVSLPTFKEWRKVQLFGRGIKKYTMFKTHCYFTCCKIKYQLRRVVSFTFTWH